MPMWTATILKSPEGCSTSSMDLDPTWSPEPQSWPICSQRFIQPLMNCCPFPQLWSLIGLTQDLNPGLLLCKCILYHLSHQGSPNNTPEWMSNTVPFCRLLSQIPGNGQNNMTKRENKWSMENISLIQFSSVQLLSRVRLFVTPWIAARQASLSITNSWSSLRLTSIKSVNITSMKNKRGTLVDQKQWEITTSK